MTLDLRFRAQLEKVSQFLVRELTGAYAIISTAWNQQHADDGGHSDITADSLHVDGKITLNEQLYNPDAADLSSVPGEKDRLTIYMKADKLVIAYNNTGTVTYITLDLDGSDTTLAHSSTAP